MGYNISFKSSVSKDLKKIDKKKLKEILDKIETELSKTILNNKTVLILRIAHRKEVYRK